VIDKELSSFDPSKLFGEGVEVISNDSGESNLII